MNLFFAYSQNFSKNNFCSKFAKNAETLTGQAFQRMKKFQTIGLQILLQ